MLKKSISPLDSASEGAGRPSEGPTIGGKDVRNGRIAEILPCSTEHRPLCGQREEVEEKKKEITKKMPSVV